MALSSKGSLRSASLVEVGTGVLAMACTAVRAAFVATSLTDC